MMGKAIEAMSIDDAGSKEGTNMGTTAKSGAPKPEAKQRPKPTTWLPPKSLLSSATRNKPRDEKTKKNS